MMNKKTSYKRIVSLVLSIMMVAAMLSVSAAGNTMIYVNGDLAVDGQEFTDAVTVSIKGDFVSVEVNDKKVELNDDNTFVIDPEADDAEEPADTADEPVETAAEPTDTEDTAETSDSAEPAGALAEEAVVAAKGDVKIAVYGDTRDDVLSVVTIVINEKSDETGSDDEAKGSDDEAKGSDDEAKGSDDEAKGSDDEAKGSDDEAKGSDDEAKGSDDEAKGSDDQPGTGSDDQPGKGSDDQPGKGSDDQPGTDDQPDTDDQPQKIKVMNGDVSGDNKITSYDALLILRYSNNMEKNFTKTQIAQADVTGNGVFSDDALVVLRASAKLGTINPEYIEVVAE